LIASPQLSAQSDSNLGRAPVAASRQEGEFVESRIVDPLSDPDWDRVAASHPQSNIFHRTAWARVLCRTYGHRPVYLQFYRENQPVALVPIMQVASPFTGRRGVSLPFSDFCEPLVFGEWGRESLTRKLLELGRARRWRYFELRGGRESLPESAVSGERYYGHKLDLSIGLDRIWDGLQSSVRRAIHKAENSGLVAEVSRTWNVMKAFYRLHVGTRRRHGVPPQPLSFFRNIHEEVITAGLGFVVLARRQLEPTAGAVFFHSGGAALYKFGASDERFQEFRGNNLVMWAGIKQLVGKGFVTMHFGRTANSNDGLRRFKLSWGTEEETIEYFRFPLRRQAWDKNTRDESGLYNKLFSRLPLAVNRLAGALVYPHLD
jgi:hypothetical protein